MSAPVSFIECVSKMAYTRVLSCVMLALISSIINCEHSIESCNNRYTGKLQKKKTKPLKIVSHVGIYVQVQSSIDRTAAPFSPQQSTTKVALAKASAIMLEISASMTQFNTRVYAILETHSIKETGADI